VCHLAWTFTGTNVRTHEIGRQRKATRDVAHARARARETVVAATITAPARVPDPGHQSAGHVNCVRKQTRSSCVGSAERRSASRWANSTSKKNSTTKTDPPAAPSAWRQTRHVTMAADYQLPHDHASPRVGLGRTGTAAGADDDEQHTEKRALGWLQKRV